MKIPNMIPSKIRTEGRELFQRIKVPFDQQNKEYFKSPQSYGDIRLQLEPGVRTRMKSFDLEDFSCSCLDWMTRGICKHYIALELYYQSLSDEIKERIAAGSEKFYTFADQLLSSLPSERIEEEANLEPRVQFYLSAEVEILQREVKWTLKIRPDDAKRSYIIKNVASFVRVVLQEEEYTISKKYHRLPLSLDVFDEPSQNLILFINKVFFSQDEFQRYFYNNHCERHVVFAGNYFAEAFPLLQALESLEFKTSKTSYTEVFLDSTPWLTNRPIFKVIKEKHYYQIRYRGKFGSILNRGELLIRENHFYVVPHKYRDFLASLDDWFQYYRNDYPLLFTLEQRAELIRVCQILSFFCEVTLLPELEVREFVPIFSFQKKRESVHIDMVWDFGEEKVSSKQELHKLPFAYDSKLAEKITRQLRRSKFQDDFSSLSSVQLDDFFLKELPRFRALGQVELDEELENCYIEDPANIDILDKDGYLSVQFDFSMISEDEIDRALRALWNQESHYKTKQGQVFVFNDESLKVAKGLQDLRANFANGQIKMHKSRAFTLAESFKDSDAVNFSRDFQQMAYDLAHPEEFDSKPYEVAAKLRHYQKDGVKWMSMLAHYNFGGILADDMGLGKTLQTIALLQANLKPEQKVLILAPASLLYNWKEEFRKFTPDMNVEVSYGVKSSRKEAIQKQATVTITSYQSFRSDLKEYQKYSYDYLILDEAQAVKNSQTKVAQALRDFDVKICYALSGTPIENRLEEIWSIFQIVLPGLLPSKREFSKLSPEMVAKLIQPFILRRKKEDVAQELPPLTEHLYSNELTSGQKTLYLAQLKQMQALVSGASSEEIKRHKIEILAGLTRLRQICNTPALFMEDYEGESGKMTGLMELLQDIRDKGGRPLIFSQFTGMLDLVEQELDKQDLSHFKITGQTASDKRQEMVNRFNKGEKDCFLISLKAGGTGLNLTGADTVVLCDLWWNPAVEMQAIGRSHRIGQTRQVNVYRLITLGTIEEKIQELQESKKELVNTVLDGQESKSNLSVEDIKEILGVE